MKIYQNLILLSFVLCLGHSIAIGGSQLANLGAIIISPNGPVDGGDYGPQTPGTRTAGFQEAFDYAKRIQSKDIFIVGGPNVIYNLSTTLTIPWFKNINVDGGNYTMIFSQTSGDGMVIDSQMNGRFKFGVIAAPNLTCGSIARLWPQTAGPDGLVTISNCHVRINAIRGSGSGGTSLGLQLDNPRDSEISFGNIQDCNTGIYISDGDNIVLTCSSIRSCRTMFQIDAGKYCRIDTAFDPKAMMEPPVGAYIVGGTNNIYRFAWMDVFDTGLALVFGGNAHDNLVYAMNLPVDGIANATTRPTNRVVSLKPHALSITTPSVPASGCFVLNETSYSVVALITGAGSVSSWAIRDTKGTTRKIDTALYVGQSILLDPGDSILFVYASPPTWRWRALR